MSGAHPRKGPTERQKLLGHLLDHHRALPNAAVARWSLGELEGWHAAEHGQPGAGHVHA